MLRAFLFFLFLQSASAEVLPGLARFDLYSGALANRRVGLVVNQASVFHGQHAIELLQNHGVRLVKLYGLEHGVRGEGGAGQPIGDGVDPQSGLPVVSLYGPRRKPDPASLAGVDVLVFDVQDVGTRFFTYISSLGLILEAAAENHLPVVVLDRPNPNADYTDGPVLKAGLHSFVGAYPIPVVYGLTIGELARMIAGEGWQHTPGLRLQVVPLSGYDRRAFEMPEGKPSPGLRSLNAIRAYPWLTLFEPTNISLGRGTEHPYELFGRPGKGLGDFSFTPKQIGPGDPPLYLGQECFGTEFFSRPALQVPRFTTDFFSAANPRVTDPQFLNLLVGDKAVVAQMIQGVPWAKIRAGLENELREFTLRRRPYLLY
ncbi:MAG: exo-beta-N-acetylmuramidase NamZ family protein [Bdellovibrionota bacterium]